MSSHSACIFAKNINTKIDESQKVISDRQIESCYYSKEEIKSIDSLKEKIGTEAIILSKPEILKSTLLKSQN